MPVAPKRVVRSRKTPVTPDPNPQPAATMPAMDIPMKRKNPFAFLAGLKKFGYTPILMTLLLIASFFLGMLVDKVQYLSAGQAYAPTAAQPQAGAQQPVPGQKQNVSNGHFPVLGKSDAKVTIIEFADLRCPFCERFFTDTEPQIIKNYVDTGKAKFIFRQYAFLGPASTVAANAAECANEQGKFWDMHNYFYKNQPDESDTSMYNTDKLTEIAETLGMNTDQFRSCLDTNKYNDKVSADFSEGQKVGVTGTPTIFVDGTPLVGAQPYESFKQLIDAELAKK
jgi:protein-disulfide isomerase